MGGAPSGNKKQPTTFLKSASIKLNWIYQFLIIAIKQQQQQDGIYHNIQD